MRGVLDMAPASRTVTLWLMARGFKQQRAVQMRAGPLGAMRPQIPTAGLERPSADGRLDSTR